MIRKIGLYILIFIIMFNIVLAQNFMPQTMTYQGYLTDAQDGSQMTGTYTMDFAIYDALTGGNNLWDEIGASVPVSKGMFSYALGTTSPLNLSGSGEYYFELTINGENLERVNMTQAMWAQRAQQANNLTETNSYSVVNLEASGNITAESTIITSDAGMIFPTLQDMWAFTYGDDSGAPNSGVFFNSVLSAIENRLFDFPWLISHTNGNLELLAGVFTPDNDVALMFNGQDNDGQIQWMEDEAEFRPNATFRSTYNMFADNLTAAQNVYVGNYLYDLDDTGTFLQFPGDRSIHFYASGYPKMVLEGGSPGGSVSIGEGLSEVDFTVYGLTDNRLLSVNATTDQIDIDGNINISTGRNLYFNVSREIEINPARFKLPGVNPPEEVIIGVTNGLAFNKATNESVYTSMHATEDYCGDDFEIAFYWAPNDAGDTGSVKWCVEALVVTAESNELINNTGTVYCTTDAAQSEQYELLKTSNVVLASANIDDQASFRVFRGADDTEDDYDDDAILVEATIYYNACQLGETN